MLGDRVIAEGVADLPRPDVHRALGTGGDQGFRFSAVEFSARDAGRVSIQARPSPEAPWRRVRKGRHLAPPAPAAAPESGAQASLDDAVLAEMVLAGGRTEAAGTSAGAGRALVRRRWSRGPFAPPGGRGAASTRASTTPAAARSRPRSWRRCG